MCGKSPNAKNHNFNLPGKKVVSVVLLTLTMNSLSSSVLSHRIVSGTVPPAQTLHRFFYNRRKHLTIKIPFHHFSLTERCTSAFAFSLPSMPISDLRRKISLNWLMVMVFSFGMKILPAKCYIFGFVPFFRTFTISLHRYFKTSGAPLPDKIAQFGPGAYAVLAKKQNLLHLFPLYHPFILQLEECLRIT